ncbi:glutathione S-transferase family protein [Pontivivens insulae]|uniref:Disulfide-bond oxidoreductase YfcG n=1 Tax=Pontivivens insulae TaxID=1639689 RepID=A0A2R8AAN5_9RHOB|nr:glutathione S-transferase [Pontivivens insulae]RED13028.1 glutathione S-transferase [Pontivivens insulae]SPF29120.1 Disulfide-bond oxidoreductase YfcG [Pontivivens insulae]
MADYKLHCFAESGHSYKAALMLELSGANWEPVFADFMNGALRQPEYLETNEMAEAPVLEHKGTKLSQSGVILDYLSTSLGKFAPGSADERREVLRWILWDNHKMSSQVGLTRFLMNFLPEEKRPEQVIGFMQGRLKAAYTVLDRRLEGRDWVAAEHCTIADFSCCSYLYYPEPFGFDRADWPNIAAWLDRIAAIDGWQHPYDLMPGRT